MTDSQAHHDSQHETALRIRAELRDFAESADAETVVVAGLVIDLLTLAADLGQDPANESRASELIEFCSQQAPVLTRDAKGTHDEAQLTALGESIVQQWGDYLELLDPAERFAEQRSQPECYSTSDSEWEELTSAFELVDDVVPDADAEDDAITSSDISRLLAVLNTADEHSKTPQQTETTPPTAATAETGPALPLPATTSETLEDPELLAAYCDDAQQCLAEMEASLLQLDSGTTSPDPLRQFCRQLHTLKGASGTVGLAPLARYLHELENYVETTVATAGKRIDVDRLLACVDVVRAQLAALSPDAGNQHFAVSKPVSGIPFTQNSQPTTAATPTRTTAAPAPQPPAPAEGEQYVRIEASRLDRLMDLLAELVMLRNRRDTYVKSLRTLHDELNYCSARTRSLTMNVATDAPTESGSAISVIDDDIHPASTSGQESSISRVFARSLIELSNDVTELGRSLDEVCEPLSVDNAAVSHLIGRFRQELMELRRLPISGLFQRLQRTVRDAARAEEKQVELVFVGQGARAERALQERLFEPLMHLVRNGVSHGIETPQERLAAGKSAQGHITLEAWSDTSYLFIEIKDDGKGLNDDALEARGRELGLLPTGQSVGRERLWKLIFQPGFSTRKQVGEISGRGVGMDVVDSWIRRLRGRIDVDSIAGQGTTFRLQIPLRSAIEHAMIVRVGGQLFALPMQSIEGTVAPDLQEEQVQAAADLTADSAPLFDAIALSELLDMRDSHAGRPRHLSLKAAGSGRLTIAVEAVVGVEEVVVRSLPPLLQRHDLFAGVTLSGRAETVLLIDVPQLIEFASRRATGNIDANTSSAERKQLLPRQDQLQILIADDSVTVRRSLSRRLKYQGFATVEASNGVDALRLLQGGGIAAVITDIDMPRMSGLELLQEMQSQPSLQQIPVLVVTSRDDRATLAQVSQLGAAQVLTKPMTETTICDAIEGLLQSKSPR